MNFLSSSSRIWLCKVHFDSLFIRNSKSVWRCHCNCDAFTFKLNENRFLWRQVEDQLVSLSLKATKYVALLLTFTFRNIFLSSRLISWKSKALKYRKQKNVSRCQKWFLFKKYHSIASKTVRHTNFRVFYVSFQIVVASIDVLASGCWERLTTHSTRFHRNAASIAREQGIANCVRIDSWLWNLNTAMSATRWHAGGWETRILIGWAASVWSWTAVDAFETNLWFTCWARNATRSGRIARLESAGVASTAHDWMALSLLFHGNLKNRCWMFDVRMMNEEFPKEFFDVGDLIDFQFSWWVLWKDSNRNKPLCTDSRKHIHKLVRLSLALRLFCTVDKVEGNVFVGSMEVRTIALVNSKIRKLRNWDVSKATDKFADTRGCSSCKTLFKLFCFVILKKFYSRVI